MSEKTGSAKTRKTYGDDLRQNVATEEAKGITLIGCDVREATQKCQYVLEKNLFLGICLCLCVYLCVSLFISLYTRCAHYFGKNPIGT